MESMPEGDYRLNMPPVNGGEYLVSSWHKCGMCLQGMSGAIPLTWQELDAYCSRSGANLDGWESEQIIAMSRAYVNMSRKADELNCHAPYVHELTEEQEQEIKQAAAINARSILKSKKKAS